MGQRGAKVVVAEPAAVGGGTVASQVVRQGRMGWLAARRSRAAADAMASLLLLVWRGGERGRRLVGPGMNGGTDGGPGG
ncbi:hypothetical protein NL676_031862 [Syzygium grande]|nr:hypothetical protein NL676_031862 [Syzygium grande]